MRSVTCAANAAPGDGMPVRSPAQQHIAPWRRRNGGRIVALVRILTLTFLFLLPVQMQAGGDEPHPHALLQLLLDAGDGSIDHHLADENPRHGADENKAMADGAAPRPDLPAIAEGAMGAGIALLTAVILIFWVPDPTSQRAWSRPRRWRDSVSYTHLTLPDE